MMHGPINISIIYSYPYVVYTPTNAQKLRIDLKNTRCNDKKIVTLSSQIVKRIM